MPDCSMPNFMIIVKHGLHYRGTCSSCFCEVLVPNVETKTKYVSRLYPSDSIGFLEDKDKKLIIFVKCPECIEDITLTKEDAQNKT